VDKATVKAVRAMLKAEKEIFSAISINVTDSVG
jgi:hypothetical protein